MASPSSTTAATSHPPAHYSHAPNPWESQLPWAVTWLMQVGTSTALNLVQILDLKKKDNQITEEQAKIHSFL